MRKILIYSVSILALVFIVLSMLGKNSEHAAEKHLYIVLKNYDDLNANPDVAPPYLLDRIENRLRKIIKVYPETKAARTSYMKLVQFYVRNKKTEKALALCDEMIEKYDDKLFTSKAKFLKVALYEEENRWNDALLELKDLHDNYITTPIGMQAKSYIALYYKRTGQKEEAARLYEEAINFYENLKSENQGTMLGYASSSALFQLHLNFEKYEDAGNTIEAIVFEYPAPSTIIQQLAPAELVFVKLLKNPEHAIKLYKFIRDRLSDKKVIEFIDQKIEEFKNPEKIVEK